MFNLIKLNKTGDIMKVDINDIDFFPAKLIKVGGSLAVIFPLNNVKFSGLKEKDEVKVYYKKII